MSHSTCSIEGCESRRKTRGWCQTHYVRWLKTGDPGPAGRLIANRAMTTRQRFERIGWDLVVRRADLGPCWEWRGARSSVARGYGYGALKLPSGSMSPAHRVAFELYNGTLPDGEFACHRCDNPPCVNPAHLFAGTARVNGADMRAKGRSGEHAGELHPSAKVSDADVAVIRDRYATGGETYRSLAARFGISPANVGMIVRRASRTSPTR